MRMSASTRGGVVDVNRDRMTSGSKLVAVVERRSTMPVRSHSAASQTVVLAVPFAA